MKRNIITLALASMLLASAVETARGQQVREDLRIEEAGLVGYNIVETAKGDIPSSVAYFRADGTHPEMHWSRIETSPGRYNFRPFLDALEEGRRKGVKIGLRIMTANPHGRVFPGWIKSKSVTRDGRTATAPDWDDPGVQQAIRNLLIALGQQVRNHPAFLFADIAAVGWVGEFHTEWGPFKNADFMPTIESQKKYVDYHAQAFGADRLVANLGMDTEVLAYAISIGANGWRQDGFGNSVKLMTEYPPQFRDVPGLWDVTGPRLFEIWGSNISEWPNEKVTWPIDEIFDEALKYRTTMFANMGASIPSKYADAYKRFHRSMMDYAIR
ncbi:MAG: hypothetical protein ACC655_09770 [Rhodothermia bacterium]